MREQNQSRLTVLTPAFKIRGKPRPHVTAVCQCGEIKNYQECDIKAGRTLSCGCLQREKAKELAAKMNIINKARNPTEEEVKINRIVSNYKTNAKARGMEFHLNREEIIGLLQGDCHYCGNKPKSHNGIDRVNNELPYEKGNVVSCCKRCNVAKNDMTEMEFYQLIKDIHAKRIEKTT